MIAGEEDVTFSRIDGHGAREGPETRSADPVKTFFPSVPSERIVKLSASLTYRSISAPTFQRIVLSLTDRLVMQTLLQSDQTVQINTDTASCRISTNYSGAYNLDRKFI